MIDWEAGFFIMVVGGVGVIGMTLVCAVVELGRYIYKKTRTRKPDVILPW
jgi:hypothetical protein